MLTRHARLTAIESERARWESAYSFKMGSATYSFGNGGQQQWLKNKEVATAYVLTLNLNNHVEAGGTFNVGRGWKEQVSGILPSVILFYYI